MHALSGVWGIYFLFCQPTAACSQSQLAPLTSGIREVDRTIDYPSKQMRDTMHVFSFSSYSSSGHLYSSAVEYRKSTASCSTIVMLCRLQWP